MLSYQTTASQRTFTALGLLGLILLFSAGVATSLNTSVGLLTGVALCTITTGILGYTYASYVPCKSGIKNNANVLKSLTNRGVWAYLSALALTSFYILLYFFESALEPMIRGFDPISQMIAAKPASQWFVYGVLYTLAILLFGVKFIVKYRHSRYQVIRTISVMFFQLIFAFLLPEFMARLNGDLPYYDLKSMWPLNYYLFDSYYIESFVNAKTLGIGLLLFGLLSIFVISPILTYKFGKRWYCSWVCGCGGLAETAGDAFRHLSDNRIRAWKLERWMIHSILVFVTLSTVGLVHSYLLEHPEDYWLSPALFLSSAVGLLVATVALIYFKRREWLAKEAKTSMIIVGVLLAGLTGMHFLSDTYHVFLIPSYTLRSVYGFFVGSIFSGVIGTGFYPLLGNRVWCRFGCPMAALLGIQQKLFSKFQITTNSGQCISCGNCSAYCEMGIDVRAYAQKAAPIKRASCVGCGICAEVCPRGVLRLENTANPHLQV
ncbi:MAG: hypothetical protein RLZZ242_1465 [Bacteroidota bacterium]|jgi:polyferredoxin